MAADTWKLQDAKAQFSEVVRRARAGAPQEVTVHGRRTVVVVDVDRFDITAKGDSTKDKTMADFIERSRKYRLDADVDFEQPLHLTVRKRELFKRRRPRR